MTDVATALPSAGWYADPSDAGRLRWWDGLGWSQNSMPVPAAAEPSAPPMSHAPTVDEHRLAESPRRSARAAWPQRGEDELAPVTQLRPLPMPDPQALVEQGIPGAVPFDTAFLTPDAGVPAISRPADPQSVVPPITVPQDATPDVAPDPHLPQLGLVPAEVFAPEPVAVAVAPVATAAAPQAFAPVGAPMPTVAHGTVPAPGQLVAGPAVGTVAETPLAGAATITATIAAPAAAAPAVAAPAVATGPSGLPASPEALQAPVAQPERRQTVQDDTWWLGLVPSSSRTISSWLLALSPLFAVGTWLAAVAVVVWLPQFTIALSALGLIALLLPFVLAAADRRRLIAQGWMRPASAALMLLGPFWYLIGRQVVLRRQGATVNPLLAVTIAVGLLTPTAVYAALMLFQEQLHVLMLILELRY